MILNNTTILALIICIAGTILLLGYFFYQEDVLTSTNMPKTEQTLNTPQQGRQVSSEEAQHSASRSQLRPFASKKTQQISEPDISDAPPESIEQVAPEQCVDCGKRVLAFLSDPANDEAAKVDMARTWLKPETKEETLSLLRLLKEAHDSQQNDLKDRLLQMLAGADSGESAELLISVLNGDLPDFSLKDLPEDLSYAIKKAIRLNPDETTGKRLAEEFSYQRPEETLAAVQDVKHPDMVYQLALDADGRGEKEKVGELVQSLQTFEDPRTVDVFTRLSKAQVLSEEEAFKQAADWAEVHQDSVAADKYEAALSDPAAEPTARIVAAAVLAAGSEPAQAIAALRKAAAEEADQNLLSYYEKAIEQANRRMEPAAEGE